MLISSTTFEVFEWPAFSYDVKFIEKIWAVLSRKPKKYTPKSKTILIPRIAQELVKIPNYIARNYTFSMRHKMQI